MNNHRCAVSGRNNSLFKTEGFFLCAERKKRKLARRIRWSFVDKM